MIHTHVLGVCAILDMALGLQGFQLTEIYENCSTGEIKKNKNKQNPKNNKPAESHYWNLLKGLHDLYKLYQTNNSFILALPVPTNTVLWTLIIWLTLMLIIFKSTLPSYQYWFPLTLSHQHRCLALCHPAPSLTGACLEATADRAPAHHTKSDCWLFSPPARLLSSPEKQKCRGILIMHTKRGELIWTRSYLSK